MEPATIRAVVFDAVGTLIHPDPPAAEIYAAVGRKYGSRLTFEEVRSRFALAFERQETLDRQSEWRTSEAREVERWRSIVFEVLDDAADRDACFEELFDHFGRSQNWRAEREAAEILKDLRTRGYRTGIASNFDRRLRSVLAGLPDMVDPNQVIISSEIGSRKPAPEFFCCVAQRLGLTAGQVLFVGDNPVNDYAGATAAGFQAVLLDPKNRAGAVVSSINALTALTDMIR